MDITPFDLAGSLQAHNQLVQQQRAQDTQNAFAQALPMLQTDPQNALATIGKTGNLDAYSRLSTIISQKTTQDQAKIAAKTAALAKVGLSLRDNKDYADPIVRKAVARNILATSPELAAAGVTADDVERGDWSDNGINTLTNLSRTVDQIVAQSNTDRTFQAGRSDHADTLANEVANRNVTLRGQNMTDARAREVAARAKADSFSSPTTIEVPDGKGGTKQVLAQQNKVTGQWTSADEKRTPIDATGINMPDKASGGTRTAGQMLRMVSAAHTVGNELENIAALPSSANSGLFSGQSDTSVRGMLAREITPAEAQSYNTANTGLARALAQMETAGLAPPGTFTKQIEGLTLQPGDTEFNHMQKLATVRQTAEGILDAVANSPIATKKQVDEINGLKARFSKAIPFTPMDVIKLQRKANPGSTTIADRARHLGLGPQEVTKPGNDGWGEVTVHK